MSAIQSVHFHTILDSRGNQTVEAKVTLNSGITGRAAAPSGASTGEHEAVSLPPQEAIDSAVDQVPSALRGVNPRNQRDIDARLQEIDGTDDFSSLGANSAVAVSMATAKAAANELGISLYEHLGGAFRGYEFPIPLGNVLGGGEHARKATDIQEFLSVPIGASSITDAVFANATVHQTVGAILTERDISAGKGDEGAWAPSISDEEAFAILTEATNRVTDEFGFDVRFGIDFAASELFDADTDTYEYRDVARSIDDQIDYVADLVDEYDLVFVEDPIDENDYEGFIKVTERIGDRTVVCGDDIFVTNTDRLEKGIELEAANSVLIKPNQIGTLSQTMDAVELGERAGWQPVISHRSGETTDTTIAHFAVAIGAPFIKTGAVSGERIAKLNELIRIVDGF